MIISFINYVLYPVQFNFFLLTVYSTLILEEVIQIVLKINKFMLMKIVGNPNPSEAHLEKHVQLRSSL